jgi:cytochrome c oxidase subunit 1
MASNTPTARSAHDAHIAHEAHEHHPTGWRRFVYSTNHKDIGTMYLVFALVAGVIGGLLSIGIGSNCRIPASKSSRRRRINVFVTARPDHDLLHGDAGDDRRVRQLLFR